MSVKRYCGRAAAGTETSTMNPMVEWYEDGGDNQDTPYVLASDYDALAAEVAGYKESHEKYCPSAARIRDLEAALGVRDAANVSFYAALAKIAAEDAPRNYTIAEMQAIALKAMTSLETKGEQG